MPVGFHDDGTISRQFHSGTWLEQYGVIICQQRKVKSTEFVSYRHCVNACQSVRAIFHLTISMLGQRATGKIQRNNYHHGSCGLSLTGKTSSVSLIFTHRTHRNVKNRCVKSSFNRIMPVPGQRCRFQTIPASCERGLNGAGIKCTTPFLENTCSSL